MLKFLRDDVPRNWRTYCDEVSDNFRVIDPGESLGRRRHAGLQDATTGPSRRSIALDGKTLRRSFDNFNDRKAAQVLHAFDVEAGLVLAHVDIAKKVQRDPRRAAVAR